MRKIIIVILMLGLTALSSGCSSKDAKETIGSEVTVVPPITNTTVTPTNTSTVQSTTTPTTPKPTSIPFPTTSPIENTTEKTELVGDNNAEGVVTIFVDFFDKNHEKIGILKLKGTYSSLEYGKKLLVNDTQLSTGTFSLKAKEDYPNFVTVSQGSGEFTDLLTNGVYSVSYSKTIDKDNNPVYDYEATNKTQLLPEVYKVAMEQVCQIVSDVETLKDIKYITDSIDTNLQLSKITIGDIQCDIYYYIDEKGIFVGIINEYKKASNGAWVSVDGELQCQLKWEFQTTADKKSNEYKFDANAMIYNPSDYTKESASFSYEVCNGAKDTSVYLGNAGASYDTSTVNKTLQYLLYQGEAIFSRFHSDSE